MTRKYTHLKVFQNNSSKHSQDMQRRDTICSRWCHSCPAAIRSSACGGWWRWSCSISVSWRRSWRECFCSCIKQIICQISKKYEILSNLDWCRSLMSTCSGRRRRGIRREWWSVCHGLWWRSWNGNTSSCIYIKSSSLNSNLILKLLQYYSQFCRFSRIEISHVIFNLPTF